MKAAHLFVSEAAAADIMAQADWYQIQSGKPLAARWGKAVTTAVLRIVKSPRSGAPCAFQAPELRNLRRVTITGFPKHLIFYRFADREIVLLRVVHGARDLERLL